MSASKGIGVNIRQSSWWNALFALLLVSTAGWVMALTNSGWVAAALIVIPILLLWAWKSPTTLLLFWLIGSPLGIQTFNITFPGIPNITPERVILPLLAARTFVPALLPQREDMDIRTHERNVLLFLSVAYLAAELVGYLRSPIRFNTAIQWYADRAVLPVIAFWLGRSFGIGNGPQFGKTIEKGVLCIGLVAVLVEILRLYCGLEEWLYPGGRAVLFEDLPGGRAIGGFYNPAVFGAIVAMAIGALLMKMRAHTTPIDWAVLLMLCWGVGRSYTRSVWLAFALMMMLLAAVGIFGRRTAVLLGYGFGLTAAGLMWHPEWFSRISERIFNVGNLVTRADLVSQSLMLFERHPLVGWGAGFFDYGRLGLPMINAGTSAGIASHNSFLLMLVDRGLLAFVPYVLFFACLLRLQMRDSKYLRKSTAWTTVITAILGLLGFVVTSLFIQVEYFPYYLSYIWLLLGVAEGIRSGIHTETSQWQ